MKYNKGNRPFRQKEQEFKGLSVEVRNGDVNKAIRIFKKKVQEDGVIQDYKERQNYTKPSEARRKAKAAGRKRWLKKVEKRKQELGF